jgi:hypothetical protein
MMLQRRIDAVLSGVHLSDLLEMEGEVQRRVGFVPEGPLEPLPSGPRRLPVFIG